MKKFYADETKTGGDAKPPADASKEQKTPLKPTLTKATTQHGKTEDVLVLRQGQVYVVPLDDKGQEIEGAGFITNQAAFDRHYKNPKKFTLKKKAS